jgi:hypothetical protein
MATQAELQALIDNIVTGANFPATQMNPLLQGILNQAYSESVVQEIAMVNAATTQLTSQCGSAVLSNSVSTYTVKLPANPLVGQKVVIFISATGTVGTLSIKDSDGIAVASTSAVAFDTITYSYTGTAWIQTGFAGTIV